MIYSPQPDTERLQRDLFAHRASCLRRRLQRRRAVLMMGTPLVLLALLVLRPGTEAPSGPATAPQSPNSSPVISSSTPEREDLRPTRSVQVDTLDTDEELMAALADQGPMLITHPDGRKQLILTRPR